ncbi:MAG: AAA family ATPase [Peptococcaceae bacterium]|nr:AAA family ATPase [Peptococcaceae bacterium]
MAYLKQITLNWDKVNDKDQYPFNIPALSRLDTLDLNQNVVFIVGENGTGKSTLLEAIAYQCGFDIGGGSRNNDLGLTDKSVLLSSIMTLSWMSKVTKGFFLRAETFFNFAQYLDEMAKEHPAQYEAYGGKSLNEQSHGEGFIALFTHRFGGKSLYILDEPEAALSPLRQFALLKIIHDLEQDNQAQFIIATHSPILMAYPGALIYQCDEDGFHKTNYEETEHYRLTKAFLDNPERFFRELFKVED